MTAPLVLPLPSVPTTVLPLAEQRIIDTAFAKWGASWRYHGIQRRHVLVIPKTHTPDRIEWECPGDVGGTLLDLIRFIESKFAAYAAAKAKEAA